MRRVRSTPTPTREPVSQKGANSAHPKPYEVMDTNHPALSALQRAADQLAGAATDLTLAMVAAGHTPLGRDACVLAEAVEAELAAVAAILGRYRIH